MIPPPGYEPGSSRPPPNTLPPHPVCTKRAGFLGYDRDGAFGDTYVMILYRYKAEVMLIIRVATKEIREERSVENAGIFVKEFLV